jgi:glycosyltransferase involved in cell wall biosynthesis
LRDAFVFSGAVTTGLSAFYQIMDLMLMTSKTESFPNVVVEALGNGAFVISGAVGDVPQVLRNEWSGSVVENDSPGEFVRKVDRALMQLPNIRAKRNRRIAEARQEFGMARMLNEYDAVLWQSAEEASEKQSLVFRRIRALAAWLRPAQRMSS